jgi:hypothetical protein
MTILYPICFGPEDPERKRWVIGFCPEFQNHPTSGLGKRGDLSLPIGPDDDPHPGIGKITPAPASVRSESEGKNFS